MQKEGTAAADKDIVVLQKCDHISGVVCSRMCPVVAADESLNLSAETQADHQLRRLLDGSDLRGPRTAPVRRDLCTHIIKQRTVRTVHRKGVLP